MPNSRSVVPLTLSLSLSPPWRGQKCRSVRLAALALLPVHGHWAACALHVRVCAPEEYKIIVSVDRQALQDVRRAAAGLTCGPP